jgi:hypothetical protein
MDCEKQLQLRELMNYQAIPDVKTDKKSNHWHQPVSQLLTHLASVPMVVIPAITENFLPLKVQYYLSVWE